MAEKQMDALNVLKNGDGGTAVKKAISEAFRGDPGLRRAQEKLYFKKKLVEKSA